MLKSARWPMSSASGSYRRTPMRTCLRALNKPSRLSSNPNAARRVSSLGGHGGLQKLADDEPNLPIEASNISGRDLFQNQHSIGPHKTAPSHDGKNRRGVREQLKLWQQQNPPRRPDLSLAHASEEHEAEAGSAELNRLIPDDENDAGDQYDMDREFDQSYFPEEYYDHSLVRFLRRGDLVELASTSGSDGEGTLAIYVRSVDWQQQFYTIRGKWSVVAQRFVAFPIAQFVPPEMVDKIVSFFPTEPVGKDWTDMTALEGGVPREIGATIINKMTLFFEESQESYRRHARVLDHLYNIIADETEDLRLSLEMIASKALDIPLSELTTPTLYAVHKILGRDTHSFHKVHFGTYIRHYVIRSKQETKATYQVSSWVRALQEGSAKSAGGKGKNETFRYRPLEDFIEKSKRLVHYSRKIRSPTTMGSVGPSSERYSADVTKNGMVYQKTLGESFSNTDKMIIGFLCHWVAAAKSISTKSNLSSVGSTILRATGMYDELPLSPITGNLFLQEIGVLEPWQDRLIFQEDIELPGHGTAPQSDKILQTSKEAYSKESFGLVDSMAHLRRDWGALPVFCVDQENAMEIDDGFSLEPEAGSEDVFWIHVHVANPSAFIPPNHPIAKQAQHFYKTLYFPDRSYPMLPSKMVQRHFSLAPNRPTLTFSSKINRTGSILETKISPGIIRNVINITPKTLRKLYGIDDEKIPVMILTVGGQLPQTRTRAESMKDEIGQSHQSSLHALREIVKAHWEQRLAKGAMLSSTIHKMDISVAGGRYPMQPHVAEYPQSCHYMGDPIIELRGKCIDPFESQETTADDLVAHLMVLAGEAAAIWCKEREVPVMFTGTVYHPEAVQTKAHQGKSIGAAGLRGLPRAIAASTPLPHLNLGLDQYTKCTSPLRRYQDLLLHWQVEAALRQETLESGLECGGNFASIFPFSKKEVDEMIPAMQFRDVSLTKAQYRALDHWGHLHLFRAFYFKEAELPETFEFLIWQKTDAAKATKVLYDGILLPFQIRARIFQSDDDTPMPELDEGDIAEVKITYVDTYHHVIAVQAMRVLRKAPDDVIVRRGYLL